VTLWPLALEILHFCEWLNVLKPCIIIIIIIIIIMFQHKTRLGMSESADRTVETNKERGWLFRWRRCLVAAGSNKFDHVTERLVDVSLSLAAVTAQRHVASAAACLVSVQQVPGTRSPVTVLGGEVDDGDVKASPRLGVDDPRLSGRAAQWPWRSTRYVGRTTATADWHWATALGVRYCDRQ